MVSETSVWLTLKCPWYSLSIPSSHAKVSQVPRWYTGRVMVSGSVREGFLTARIDGAQNRVPGALASAAGLQCPATHWAGYPPPRCVPGWDTEPTPGTSERELHRRCEGRVWQDRCPHSYVWAMRFSSRFCHP